jgi:hypothetical protein
LGRVESRNIWRETRKVQTKLAMTYTKNEEQEDTKHNAEL